ncbi:MAG: sulfatase-like hydrolase/transferase [Planctomycetaceae bacterium]|nr:sulfatase-like hydrolase/transferase [Planctomycetaceae bacterium]
MPRVHIAHVFIVASTMVAAFSPAASAVDKPNILLIFADDQAFDTIHAHGNSEIQTPNLDRLSARATTFTHAYNMGSWSGAVCVASRMMMISGKYLWHAQKDHAKTTQLYQEKGRMWPQLLEASGYDTYFTGKWHIRADAAKTFKVAANVRGGMPNQTEAGYNRPIEGQTLKWKPWDKSFGGFWKGGKHWSEVVGDDASGFIKIAKKSDSPFFMYIAFNAPHDPRQSPREYVDKYPLDNIAMPASFVPEYPFNEAMKSGRKLRDERLAPFPRTEYSVKVNRQEYYAIITHMDAQIGRILDTLEASGQADNTYIFFTADHGLAVGRHGLMGKQNMFDHSVRVPLMVVGPDDPKNTKIDARVYLQDVMATSLELSGSKKPEYVQFESLLPLINGETDKGRDAIYGAYLQSQRMVTYGDYKMILYPSISKAILYNIAKDPQELNDLAGQKSHQPTLSKLFAKLMELQQETGDELDLTKAFPNL